jgi:hypothetical protein
MGPHFASNKGGIILKRFKQRIKQLLCRSALQKAIFSDLSFTPSSQAFRDRSRFANYKLHDIAANQARGRHLRGCRTYHVWNLDRVAVYADGTPVDIPIFMAIMRTPEFKTNLNAPFTINVEVQKTIPFETLNCLLGTAMGRISTDLQKCPDKPSVVKASWVLTSNGQTVA